MQTKRLVLRRWRRADLEPFAEMNADSAVMEYYPSCLTKDESRLFIQRIEEQFEANGFGLWAFELKENKGLCIMVFFDDFVVAYVPLILMYVYVHCGSPGVCS